MQYLYSFPLLLNGIIVQERKREALCGLSVLRDRKQRNPGWNQQVMAVTSDRQKEKRSDPRKEDPSQSACGSRKLGPSTHYKFQIPMAASQGLCLSQA